MNDAPRGRAPRKHETQWQQSAARTKQPALTDTISTTKVVNLGESTTVCFCRQNVELGAFNITDW